jgi:hypothetical protein
MAETRHSRRIRALSILFFDSAYIFGKEAVSLALGSCRFFNIPSLQLTRLQWSDGDRWHTDHLFSAPPFVPTLHSLSFRGGFWNGRITNLNKLTSVAIEDHREDIDAEIFRTFILNNLSLETLLLGDIQFKGVSNGSPATLLNLRSFTVKNPPAESLGTLSTLIRVPAFQRFSSLVISAPQGLSWFMLYATGDDIVLTAEYFPGRIAEMWQDLTGYAKPTIQHVRLENPDNFDFAGHECSGITTLFTDVHTLEIGNGCVRLYPEFLDDLKQLGEQLKTIRFEIPEETEPFRMSDDYVMWGGRLLDDIEELVTYRFAHGRPLASVERMVVSRSERVNRQQGFVWRCFYNDRHLDQFIQPQ